VSNQPSLNLNDSLRVLIVADDPLARTGLASILAVRSDFNVTGQIAAGSDLAESIGLYAPDVILWDLGWDPTIGLERLADSGSLGVPILALLPDDTATINAWVAGARGLFLRSADIERIIAALPTVAANLIVLDPALGPALLAPRERAAHSPHDLPSELTARESEVLQFLAEGLPNKTIAQRLGISEHTVKFHVNAIMGKLGAQSRTDAVVRATRLGLVIL
jgi:two-component system nitrate/nitrite response regulator NarL